jgi:hypothetical protein
MLARLKHEEGVSNDDWDSLSLVDGDDEDVVSRLLAVGMV